MNTISWLDAVRPSGRGYLFTLDNNSPKQSVFNDNSDAHRKIDDAIEAGQQVFVSLAQFKDDSSGRKAESADSCKSVWLDIDCGEGDDKKYKTQIEAIEAAQAFCSLCKIPKPSVVVNSGGGVHLYWCFDTNISVARWKPISEDLKALCKAHNLHIDPAVMGDASRVMRVPGSANLKLPNSPRAVDIEHPNGEAVYFDAQSFHDFIKTAAKCAVPSIPGIPLIRPISEATRNILQTPEEIDKLKAALAKLSPDTARGSGRFYAHDGKPEDDYWMAVLWAIASLQWACGKELAREWSKGSQRYTDKGFEHAWGQFNPSLPNHVGVGSLYKRASEMGAVISVSTPTLTKSKFTLLSVHELNRLPAIEWLIKGILPNKGLAAVFGPSGSGKTFLALDMIMSIAVKAEWFANKVINAPVVYVGLEGAGGIRNRVNAWKAHHQMSEFSNFKLILGDFDLMSRSQVEDLAAAVIAEGMEGGIIVIDTLNQASPTADENASKDMGVIIQHLKLLQELTSGLVIIVHHTGKNTNAGLRGHSSLKAALDTSIEVEGDGGRRTWTLNKSKDGVAGQSYPFNLSAKQLGLDADGDPVTSCVVEYNSSVVVQRPGPTGSAQKAAYQRIKANLENSTDLNKCSSGIGVKCISVEAAIADLANTLSTTAPNKRNNRARSIVTSLITGGHLKTELAGDEGWVWLS